MAIRLAAAFGLARFLESLFFQIKPTDSLAFTVALALLLGVALLAYYMPVRRAMKVDPMIGIRHE